MKLSHKLPAQKSPISHFVKEIPALLEGPGDLGVLSLSAPITWKMISPLLKISLGRELSPC